CRPWPSWPAPSPPGARCASTRWSPCAASENPPMSAFLQNVGYGLRIMRRSPGFTTLAVLTLALGIGATTAIFSGARGVLCRPLPFPDPGRLVLVRDHQPPSTDTPVAFEEFRAWRERFVSFEEMGAYWNTTSILTGSGEPEEIWSVRLSATLLPVLG